MGTELDPIAGNWYQRQDTDERFEVISVDEDTGIVEVQYYDGEVEEIDVDAWYGLDLDAIEAPEEWAGDTELSDAEITPKGSSRSPRNLEDADDWEEEEEEPDEWEDEDEDPSWRRDD
jgi:hypothetical protein